MTILVAYKSIDKIIYRIEVYLHNFREYIFLAQYNSIQYLIYIIIHSYIRNWFVIRILYTESP